MNQTKRRDRPTKTGKKRFRGPNNIYSTQAARDLYAKIVKPFLAGVKMLEHDNAFTDGAEAFFGVASCRIAWCKAHTSFKMPGSMWASESQPYKKIDGTGRRYVKAGDTLVIRVDRARPDDSTVEFDDQVFSLKKHELMYVNEKVTAKA